MLYFDNAATSWPKPEVVYETHDRVLRQGGSAGRGVNQSSLRAGRELFHTRKALSRLFGIASTERIVFTQNITESLNVGLHGLLQTGDHVLISSLEHNAVVRPLEYLKKSGISYTIVPCSREGFLDPAIVESNFQPNTRLLCFTHASNVLGTILPIKQLGQIAKAHHCLFMVDAAQTAGVIPIDVEDQHIDFLAFTGHKSLSGPQGVGGYYARPDLVLNPLIYGGTGLHSLTLEQPDIWPEGMESGTRNIPGIAALGAAVEFILHEGLPNIRSHELQLMSILLEGLEHIPEIQILGPRDINARVGLVSCVFRNHTPDSVALELDRCFDIVTRSGLHCAPLAHQTAGTIDRGALRISINYSQAESDIAALLAALNTILGGSM
ncbi:MAG: aminotransferase class V-fold PLP-dependent enzyme [Dehalobacter sp. 4CP]|uniref:aminotransferase class V-fold PLP-dependent enzyme n=1 Tax=Dehalobacter sp. CP TaxID=2594474 RepID=UPI0013C9D4D1|nr:aminotransferase class V-fold PLP-dependent enzyme [Dehalobacter sp. 4CP]